MSALQNRVAIIDDHPLLLDGLRSLLQSKFLDIQIDTFSSAEEFLSGKHKAHISLTVPNNLARHV